MKDEETRLPLQVSCLRCGGKADLYARKPGEGGREVPVMKCPSCQLVHVGVFETSTRFPNIITRTRFPELINAAKRSAHTGG